MPSEKTQDLRFAEVIDRLKLVLDISSDRELAPALGIGYSTLTMRKTRNSLPKKAIDALIEREQLNPEFIYYGTGSVHVPLDGEAWGKKFTASLADAIRQEEGWLIREGYKEKDLKAIAAGKLPPSLAQVWMLVRDLRKVCKIDLNAFFCDEPATLDSAEMALVEAYRKAPKVGKEFILHAAGLAANVTTQSPDSQASAKNFEIDLVTDYVGNKPAKAPISKVPEAAPVKAAKPRVKKA